MSKQDSRYPYTYACDYLRMFGGEDRGGVKMSRSEASQVRGAVAKALGIDDAELAGKLADYYKANEEQLADAQFRRMHAVLGIGVQAEEK